MFRNGHLDRNALTWAHVLDLWQGGALGVAVDDLPGQVDLQSAE